jgi:DNA-directed RNA polymerase specialized sigma24 family protein
VSESAGFVDQFEELFAVAYRASFAILGGRAEAEDCAQDVLANALARWRRIEDRATPWVARVATSTGGGSDAGRIRTSRPIARATRSGCGGRADLVRALRALPRRQREAVVLRHLLDPTERDAASAMGRTTGTVKSATSRGLAALRTSLGPTWALED